MLPYGDVATWSSDDGGGGGGRYMSARGNLLDYTITRHWVLVQSALLGWFGG